MKLAKTASSLCLLFVSSLVACKDDPADDGMSSLGDDPTGEGTAGDGDGDGDPGDGDGDGDPTTGDGDGDGDGDPTTGDGDGDGDGDPGDFCAADPGWGQVAIGQPVKHVVAYDHLGNETNLCEWGGVPMVIDLSALWCGPCHMASEYLATGTTQDPFSGLGPGLRQMINDGTAKWLTYVVQDDVGGNATVMHATAWDAMYHHDNIPVLAELDTPMLPNYFQVGCWPTAWVIDPDMNFFGLDNCQTWDHLNQMIQTFGGG